MRSRLRSTAAGSILGLLAAAVLTAALVLAPGQAWADEDDEGHSDRAFDLVRQAIAIMVNTPDDHAKIEDKIEHALEAEDASNVDLTLVKEAMEAMESEDVHMARRLLEQSIGARIHTGANEPVPIGQPPRVTGESTGTIAAVDEMPGRSGLKSEDWILLIISFAIGLGGVAWAFRLRPRLPRPGPAR